MVVVVVVVSVLVDGVLASDELEVEVELDLGVAIVTWSAALVDCRHAPRGRVDAGSNQR